MRKCNPPHKRDKIDPTNCIECKDAFTKDNTYRNLGYLYRKCKKCISKENRARQKERRDRENKFKWF